MIAGRLTQTPSILKKNTRKLKVIKNEESITIFLSSISSRYITENIKNRLKDIRTYIRSSNTLPSCQRNNFLRRCQKRMAIKKQKNEKKDDFTVFILVFIFQKISIKRFFWYV